MSGAGLPGPDEAIAGGRLAELVAAAALLHEPIPPIRSRRGEHHDPLHIVFLVAGYAIGGPSRAIFEQINHLSALGTRVTVLSHFRAPEWMQVQADFRRVPFGEPIEDAIPPCDLIVACYWEFILPARRVAMAPVVHLEQGDFHLYDDLPEPIFSLISGSLAAAHATLAVGDVLTRSLRQRFGIAAQQFSCGIDLDVFHPIARSLGERRRSVLIVGWDGWDADGIDDAHQIVQRLTSGGDVEVRWATPLPPRHERFGEVIVAPSTTELASYYQHADVFLSTSRIDGFPIQPLEAMASGTPVVTSATEGVRTYAEHGRNALLAPIGDIEAMTAATRRVLDDGALAKRLRAEGLQTASSFDWNTIVSEVIGCYRAILATVSPVESLGEFAVSTEGLQFLRADDTGIFERRLESCPTSSLTIPVSQPAWSRHRVVRWRVVERRDSGTPGVSRAYLPARSDETLVDSPWQPGIDLLRDERPDRAVDWFLNACRGRETSDQIELGRWVVLALLEADRASDAAELATAFAHDFPGHPDYLYLAVLASLDAGELVDVSGPLEGIHALGNGARYGEWFEAPEALLSARLAAA